jgi:dTDP-4-dehydrorhamnose 3,5-epimerase
VDEDVTTKTPVRRPDRAADDVTLGSAPDRQSVTADWQPLQELIDGVVVKEVKHVVKDNGYLTEIWREDWKLAPTHVGQVFQALLEPGGISAWHVHRSATDRLFANHGLVKVVLYDARPESATRGKVNVLRCGTVRPLLVVVPPGVWHGVQNLGAAPALLLNLPDRPYRYDAPDHWRLPPDTDRIPYSFATGPRPNSDDPGII